MVDSVDEFTVIECINCGFRHVAPLPDNHEITRWYRERHYSDATRDRIDYYERDRDWWFIAFRDIYSVLESHLPKQRRRLVDVGTGTGIFLEVGIERGWQALGFEPNQVAAEHCRKKGLTIIPSPFPSDELQEIEQADVVHMRNVLEHVVDPLPLVHSAFRLLRPSGILVISVPNDYNPIQQAVRTADGIRPWWVAPPHHLNYFNFDSLERLALRCGLELIERFTSFPIDLFLAMGDNYVDNPSLGRTCHLRRVRLETTLDAAGAGDIRRALYRSIASAGLGRDAIVFARRPT